MQCQFALETYAWSVAKCHQDSYIVLPNLEKCNPDVNIKCISFQFISVCKEIQKAAAMAQENYFLIIKIHFFLHSKLCNSSFQVVQYLFPHAFQVVHFTSKVAIYPDTVSLYMA